jgi:hypothetical protein
MFDANRRSRCNNPDTTPVVHAATDLPAVPILRHFAVVVVPQICLLETRYGLLLTAGPRALLHRHQPLGPIRSFVLGNVDPPEQQGTAPHFPVMIELVLAEEHRLSDVAM